MKVTLITCLRNIRLWSVYFLKKMSAEFDEINNKQCNHLYVNIVHIYLIISTK